MPGMRRAGMMLANGVLGSVLFAGAPPGDVAHTDAVFDPADARTLAELLAEATAAQDVCYGWTVQVNDLETRSPTRSTGSNFGPDRSLDSAGGSCRYRVEFTADITYTPASSDINDSGRWSLISSPRGGPDTSDLNRLGLVDEGDLLGDEPDVAVARAVAALPQLAAEAGIAAPLTATPASSTPPDVGSLDDNPGSDFLRRSGGLLTLGAVLLAGGLAFGAFALYSSRSHSDPAPPVPPDLPVPPALPAPSPTPAPPPQAPPSAEH